jgi:hypothetical protein
VSSSCVNTVAGKVATDVTYRTGKSDVEFVVSSGCALIEHHCYVTRRPVNAAVAEHRFHPSSKTWIWLDVETECAAFEGFVIFRGVALHHCLVVVLEVLADSG